MFEYSNLRIILITPVNCHVLISIFSSICPSEKRLKLEILYRIFAKNAAVNKFAGKNEKCLLYKSLKPKSKILQKQKFAKVTYLGILEAGRSPPSTTDVFPSPQVFFYGCKAHSSTFKTPNTSF